MKRSKSFMYEYIVRYRIKVTLSGHFEVKILGMQISFRPLKKISYLVKEKNTK